MIRAPKALLTVAEEYLKAYEIINRHPNFKSKSYQQIASIIVFPHVKHFLLGHSLELGFKAVLLSKGLCLEYLRKKVGHNLDASLKLLEQNNFNIFANKEKRQIRLLNRHYFIKDFEYPKDGFMETPLLCEFVKIVKKTLREAKRIIHRVK